MKYLLGVVLLVFLPATLVAQSDVAEGEHPADEVILGGDVKNLDEFVWIKRPVVIFADSPADPRFIQQMQFLNAGKKELAVRDVVVLTDTDPAAQSELRDKLHPRGFMLVLIGKDGMVKLRKPFPWDVRELTRVIDKMPMRKQEIRDRRGSN